MAIDPVPPATPAVAARRSLARRLLPLTGGALALALAGLGEALVEEGNTTPLSLLLYLVAIALFALSAWPLRPRPVDQPAEALAPASARRGLAAWWLGT